MISQNTDIMISQNNKSQNTDIAICMPLGSILDSGEEINDLDLSPLGAVVAANDDGEVVCSSPGKAPKTVLRHKNR
jgi:hypothetical protein